MSKVYFYRKYVIYKNTSNPEKGKWQALEGMSDIVYGDTIDQVKNKIDDIWGGYATAKIPKRRWKNEGIID